MPLIPSTAKTVHKAQGASYQTVVANFTDYNRRDAHMVYVAISRVTSLSGLHFVAFDPKFIKVREDVMREMARLRYTKSTCITISA